MPQIDILLIDYDQETKGAILNQLKNESLNICLEYISSTDQISAGKSYDIYVFGDARRGVPVDCETICKVRQKHPSAKIIVVSDVSDEEYLQELINMHIDGFIDKGDFDVESIISIAASIKAFRDKVSVLSQKLNRLHSII
tara:strand:- start:17810 stop:18232 length:423 start_codon:yes stop_codon:yes gene_type:complete